MKIYNYINAYDFANFVSEHFDYTSKEVNNILLENDYIESSLGSRHTYLETYEGQSEIDKTISSWFDKFFETYEILEVQLKY